jgi:hypothetical protein
MAIEIINVGASANDGNGDPIRDAFIKCNDNFDELETTKISGSGTDNYVPKFNGTDAIENSQIFDNGTNVGIGTTSPQGKLTISGNSATGSIMSIDTSSTTSFIRLLADISSQNLLNWQTNTDFRFATSNQDFSSFTEKMRITSGGNVGIGTSSPTAKLHTYLADGVNDNSLRIQNGSNFYASIINLVANNDGGAIYNSISSNSNGGTEHFKIWGGASTSTMAINTGGTERMRITSGGNVGIGTTSPGALLDINGSIYSRSGSILSNNFGGYSGSDVNFTTNTSGGANLIFKTSLTERLRIDSGGNVGIGTTSPVAKLDVRGDLNLNYGTGISFGDGTAAAKYAIINTYTTDDVLQLQAAGASNGIITFHAGGASSLRTERMRITSNGNVGIGTSSPGAKLHVAGEGIFDDNTYGRLTLAFASSQNDIYSTTTGFGAWKNFRLNANELILSTGGTNERMRITSSGNVGIGTTAPQTSAILHLRSTSQGFLPPVMRTGDRNSISSPAIGLVIFNEDSQTIEVYTNAGWKSLLY